MDILDKKKFSYRDVKNILEDISSCAISSDSGISVHVIDFFSYLFSEIFKMDFHESHGLEKFSCLFEPFFCSGINYKQDIYIILNRSIFKKNYRDLIRYIFTFYHELGHIYLKDLSSNYSCFERFVMFDMEEMVSFYDHDYYLKNEDSFLLEMNADLFAIDHVKELSSIYLKEKDYVDQFCKWKHFVYDNYSFDDIFSSCYHLFVTESKSISYCFPNLYRFMRTFFDSNMNFRSVSEICSLYDKDSYGELLLNSVLSSHLFLSCLNSSCLSDDEVSFLEDVYHNMCMLENNKRMKNYQYYHDGVINSRGFCYFDGLCNRKLMELDNVVNDLRARELFIDFKRIKKKD